MVFSYLQAKSVRLTLKRSCTFSKVGAIVVVVVTTVVSTTVAETFVAIFFYFSLSCIPGFRKLLTLKKNSS